MLEYGPIYGLGFGLSEGLREALNVDLSSGLILAVCGGLVVWTSRGGLGSYVTM